jgi:predicted transcriptional regulator
MSAIELRKRIIEKLSSIEDEIILKEIYDIIKIESEIDSVYKLTPEEKIAIDAGLKDIRDGKIVSSEKANSLIKGWLKK